MRFWFIVVGGVALATGVVLGSIRSASGLPEVDVDPRELEDVVVVGAYTTEESSEDDVVAASAVVAHGTVTSLTSTYWNQNGGAPWENGEGDSEDAPAALVMHDVTLDVISFWRNQLGWPDPFVFTSLASSPVGAPLPTDEAVGSSQDDAVIQVGEEVIVFLWNNDIDWRNTGTANLRSTVGLCQGIYRVDANHNLTNCNPAGRSQTLQALQAKVGP